MSQNYEPVRKAMAAGTPLSLIRDTCPWDRLCVSPPTWTRAEIDKQMEDAKQIDAERDPGTEKMPVGVLLTALMTAGRDTAGQLCPVFAVRLREPVGRKIADAIRNQLQGLGDE